MSSEFLLQLDREGTYTLGETVRGTISAAGGTSHAAKLTLVYMERTDDYSAAAFAIPISEFTEAELSSPTPLAFECVLPEGGFPSYRSGHGELAWEIVVEVDKLGPNAHEERRIEVQAKPREPAA